MLAALHGIVPPNSFMWPYTAFEMLRFGEIWQTDFAE